MPKFVRRETTAINDSRVYELLPCPIAFTTEDGDEISSTMKPNGEMVSFAIDDEIKPPDVARCVYLLCTYLSKRNRRTTINDFRVRVYRAGEGGNLPPLDVMNTRMPVKCRFIAVIPCSEKRETADDAVNSVVDDRTTASPTSSRVREAFTLGVGEYSIKFVNASDSLVHVREPAAASIGIIFDAKKNTTLPPRRGGRQPIVVGKDSDKRVVVIIDIVETLTDWMRAMSAFASSRGLNIDSAMSKLADSAAAETNPKE